jgi:PAS domain S-box-containing protein
MDRERLERRVLVLAPTTKDAELTQSHLGHAGIDCECYSRLEQLCRQLSAGAGTIILAEEAIVQDINDGLAHWLRGQPPWSDLPILLLAQWGADSATVANVMDHLGNVTVLERPIRLAALISAVRSALRARGRQYQIRDHVAERERGIQAQAFLASIVASSDDAIVSKTLEGKILTWNAGAQRVFGYSAQEAIGQPITLVIPPEKYDEEQSILQRLRRGEPIEHFETVRITKEGRRIDVALTLSPVRDSHGKVIAASKVGRDITQAKRAAEQLRAVQEQLKVVTDNMAVAVARCSRDLRYLWISPGWTSWFGLGPNDVVGMRILDIVGPEAFALIRPHIDRALNGERAEFETLIPYERLGPRWVKAAYVPTRDHMGRTDGWVAVTTDITAYREMEAALRDADRRKDEFLAVLAHELRNPLAPIRNSLHILRKNHADSATSQKLSEMIERQVNHMVRLVDDLLDVSRITRGKIELRKEPTELATVVNVAVETSRPFIDAAGHQLTISVPPDPLIITGDQVRLIQAVANLLNNAAKYTDACGQIWLTVRHHHNRVTISVRDSGIGIPKEMLPRVFDMFTQVENHADRSRGGLGIGLTLAKSLVEMHGGTVTAYSEGLDQGSEFVIDLPLSVATSNNGTTRLAGQKSAGLAPQRVLVVDDNRDVADSMGMLLKLLGADVHVVYSGAEALQALDVYRPAVVLMDIGMPEMDGLEVARRIRQQPQYADLKLISLTGWGQEEDRLRSQNAGFDHHLVKPVAVGALEALLTIPDAIADGQVGALSAELNRPPSAALD